MLKVQIDIAAVRQWIQSGVRFTEEILIRKRGDPRRPVRRAYTERDVTRAMVHGAVNLYDPWSDR